MTDTKWLSEEKQIPLTRGKVAIVDAADYEWLMQWKWGVQLPRKENHQPYAKRAQRIGGRKQIYIAMHRAILNAPPEMLVDHINGNGLDNRRINLRLVSNAENQWNTKHHRVNNKSGFRGVHWSTNDRQWRAQINIYGRRTSLGFFDSAEDAAKAYDLAALETRGVYAHTNFPRDNSL